MRLSLALLLVALAGVLAGGALIGIPALGACLIFDSLAVGAWALLRDDGRDVPANVRALRPSAGRPLARISDDAREELPRPGVWSL